MLFWIKFIYLLCWFLIFAHGAAPLRVLSLMNTHSSKNAFFKASLIGIYFTNTLILSVAFPLLRSYQVLVWHHCHQVFTSCSARQSRALPFFPSWMYVLDGDDNCMLSVPFSTSDIHLLLAVCRKLAGDGCRSFTAIWLRIVVFLPDADDLFFLCLAVLPPCWA